MRRGIPASRLAALAVAVLVAVACSSTTSDKDAQRGPNDDVERGDVLPAPSQTLVERPRPGEPAAGSAVVSSTTVATGTRAAPSETGTIKIGILAWKPVGAVTLLDYHVQYDDPKPVIDALVAEVNANGGIAGRRVEIALTGTDPLYFSLDQAARNHNQACVELTEDAQAFLVLSFSVEGWFARHCYASHHTPFLQYVTMADEADLQELEPWLLPPVTPNLTDLAGLYVSALQEQGFIGSKIGLWVADLPSWRRSADRVLLPAIRAAGGEVVDVFYSPQATFGDFLAEMSSAVLRFRSRGVERVMFWDWSIAWSEFAKRAQHQAWFPRYGIHSHLCPHNCLPEVPAEQRRGTVAVGLSPLADVGDQQFPLTTREKECFSVVNRRAGTSFSQRSLRDNGDNPLPLAALALCQLFDMTRAALAPATGKALAQSDLWKYFHDLDDQPPVVTPPQTRFTPEKWDGAEHYAHLAYQENCDCFRYTSGWKRIRRG